MKGIEVGTVFNPYGMFYGAFIPNAMLQYKDISATAKLCWARLVQYAGDDGRAFPSQQTLAEELGVSDRQIRTVLTQLEKEQFIKRITPTGNDRWEHKTTEYVFLFHPLFTDLICRKKTSTRDRNKTSAPSLNDEPTVEQLATIGPVALMHKRDNKDKASG